MADPLGGVEVHDIASAAVGDTFRIFVGHCGPDPVATLFVTDANGLFGLAVDTVRLMQIPALVPSVRVVGIGYPGVDGVAETVGVRTRDLTPTPSRHFDGSGHADEFLTFVRTELAAWLDDRYPPVSGPSIYFGHSLGGLFGAYAMLRTPATFDHYLLSSPSLWWDDETIFELASDRSLAPTDADVFLGIGSLETDAGRRVEAMNLSDGHPAKPPARHLDMVDDLRRFVVALAARADEGIRITAVELDDEFHATVPGAILTRGLRHVFDGVEQ